MNLPAQGGINIVDKQKLSSITSKVSVFKLVLSLDFLLSPKLFYKKNIVLYKINNRKKY